MMPQKLNKYKLVLLDRDGVINEDSPSYIKSLEEWRAVPGSLLAIAKLCRHSHKIAIATNQSGIARGYLTMDTLTAIHKKMLDQVQAAGGHIDAIFICPHGPDDNCECRKPKPGMLREAAAKFDIDTSEMLFIGDSMRDMLAAKNCGADAIFIKTPHKTGDLEKAVASNIPVFSNLAEVAEFICCHTPND